MKIIKKDIQDQNTSGRPVRKVVLPPRHVTHPQTFKPGVSGNPNGRPPDDLAVKKLKKYTASVVAELLNEVLEMPMADLRRKLNADSTTGLERAIIKALLVEDWTAIDKILDRCIGKVPQRNINEGAGVEAHTHLHMGDLSGKVKDEPLGTRIKALATRLSENSTR